MAQQRRALCHGGEEEAAGSYVEGGREKKRMKNLDLGLLALRQAYLLGMVAGGRGYGARLLAWRHAGTGYLLRGQPLCSCISPCGATIDSEERSCYLTYLAKNGASP